MLEQTLWNLQWPRGYGSLVGIPEDGLNCTAALKGKVRVESLQAEA